MAPKVNFPVPKGYFGDLELTSAREKELRESITAQLQAALNDEAADTKHLDPQEWKCVRQVHQFRVYRNRKSSNHNQTEPVSGRKPSMLGIGQVAGTIEDVIYGWYEKSHDELKITQTFMDISTLDCTVLHTIETATPDDPFHCIAIKWMLTKIPIVRARDWCFIEAMGITKDKEGSRFGYIVVHSVDVPNCPPFNRKQVVRAQVKHTIILRERNTGTVDVYTQGYFDAAGELIELVSTEATVAMLTAVFKSVRCAEAKKLTLLARMHHHRREKVVSATSNTSEQDSSASKQQCCICSNETGRLKSLKPCHICHTMVCSKCRVKKTLFVGRNHASVRAECCATCIVKAHRMEVRPAEKEYSMASSDLESLFRAESGNSDSDADTPPLPQAAISKEDEEETEDEVRESNMSEEDVEAIVQSMLEQKLRSYSSNTDYRESTVLHSQSATPQPDPSIMTTPQTASAGPEAIYQRLMELHQAHQQIEEIQRANDEIMHKVC